MTKQEIIKLIEKWKADNYEKQTNPKAKETPITIDFAYEYANSELDNVLDMLKSME